MTFFLALRKLIDRYDPKSSKRCVAVRRGKFRRASFCIDEFRQIVFFDGCFSEMDGFYAETESRPKVSDLMANDWEIQREETTP